MFVSQVKPFKSTQFTQVCVKLYLIKVNHQRNININMK